MHPGRLQELLHTTEVHKMLALCPLFHYSSTGNSLPGLPYQSCSSKDQLRPLVLEKPTATETRPLPQSIHCFPSSSSPLVYASVYCSAFSGSFTACHCFPNRFQVYCPKVCISYFSFLLQIPQQLSNLLLSYIIIIYQNCNSELKFVYVSIFLKPIHNFSMSLARTIFILFFLNHKRKMI